MSTLRHLAIARSQLYVREDKGRNEDIGGQIAKYRSAVRDSRYIMIEGDPYCAAFVSWCLERADMPLVHPFGSGFSYVPWLIDWLIDEDRYIPLENGAISGSPIQIGDLVFFQHGDRPDHVGIISEINELSLTTIEGNVGSFPNGGVATMIRVPDHGMIGFGILRP